MRNAFKCLARLNRNRLCRRRGRAVVEGSYYNGKYEGTTEEVVRRQAQDQVGSPSFLLNVI
jgi:hypothetical protein